jgi:hypothetical protein
MGRVGDGESGRWGEWENERITNYHCQLSTVNYQLFKAKVILDLELKTYLR